MVSSDKFFSESQTLPSRYAYRLIEVAEESGIRIDEILETHELNRSHLADKKSEISNITYVSLIDAVLKQSKDPDIGLLVGARTTPSDHGVLGYALLASSTLRKGFERYSKFQQILSPLVQVSLSTKGNQGVLEGKEAFPLGSRYRFAISSWLSENNQYSSMYDDAKFACSLVRLTFPDNGAKPRYEDAMGCEVLFNQKANEIYFPGRFMDEPFSLADSSVAELCTQQCERILGRLDKKTVLVDKVRRAVMARPGQIPTIDNVADEVMMSSRSLRRHLGLAGTSFTAIVNDVRMNLAAEYLLNTHLPPKEIGYLVGYSEVAGFHRAFRRHFDQTPTSYRENPYKTGS